MRLPGQRDKCTGLVDQIIAGVGELHIKHAVEEFEGRNAKPRYGVKVDNLDMLPKDVVLQHAKNGVEKEIIQIIDYPNLPIRC